MIVSYKKLSEGDEKSLSEIVDAENTYIAAFKEGEKIIKFLLQILIVRRIVVKSINLQQNENINNMILLEH